jgi:shikimate dehydrogenase
MPITGSTDIYAIVGDPIRQVRSPGLFNPMIEAAGQDAVLVPLQVPEASFETAIGTLMSFGNLNGLVITYPFKERVMTHLDVLSDRARQVGGVNAMRREPDGRWTGDMFDGIGLVRAVAAQTPIRGVSILLLGAGGAGRAIGLACAEAGAAAITVCDLDVGRSDWLVERIRTFYPSCQVRRGAAIAEGHDVLINATPVGMKTGDGLPADIGALSSAMTVIDIVPYPENTPLLAAARAAGALAIPGAAMTNGQARAILEFFGLLT